MNKLISSKNKSFANFFTSVHELVHRMAKAGEAALVEADKLATGLASNDARAAIRKKNHLLGFIYLDLKKKWLNR
jgi:hypothetical protein